MVYMLTVQNKSVVATGPDPPFCVGLVLQNYGGTWRHWRAPSGSTVNDIHDHPQAQPLEFEVKGSCQPDSHPGSL